MRKQIHKRATIPVWVRRSTSWLKRHWRNLKTWQRITCASLAGVMLLTAIIPTAYHIIESRRYQLSAQVRQLVGEPNKNLASKITYNAQKDSWQFNKSGLPISSTPGQAASMPSVEDLKAQIGGGGKKDESLYAVDMPTDGRKGVTYYDTNTNLSFTLKPEFAVGEVRKKDDYLVYSAAKGVQLVYTAKTNGMKEDIVLNKPIGDNVEFSYKLNLPSDLTAKIQDDGSLGVFSADPVLYGNINFGDGQDKEKIMSARQTATKDHLLFVLPAPVIVEAGGKKASAPAHFSLNSDNLRIVTSGMQRLQYPLSIDPSVVVTSSADFATGSSDNIAYNTDQISRDTLTGGAITAGWSSTSSGSFTGRFSGASVAYNDYMYFIGGTTLTGITDEVSYAAINSNGTIGSWGTTTALPTNRTYVAAAAYNGRMYVYGGYISGTTALDTVIYATINSNGTLGSWISASTTMATATCRFGGVAYDGYLYALGGATGTLNGSCGNTSSTMLNSLQYAPILGNGDVGAWTTSGNTFTTARKDIGLAIYNGYAYATSGTTDGTTTYRDTQFTKINSDGSIGSWSTSSQQTPTNGKYRFGFRAANGYLYLNGGTNNLTGTLYAPIYANGDIGAWTASSTMSTGRYGAGFTVYKGYAYYFGGNNGTNYLTDTGYAKIDRAGHTTSFGTVANNFTTARALACSVAYNGYLYSIGGSTSDSGGNNIASIYYTAITASTGNVGTWSSTTALPENRGSAGCTAFGGYLYVISGYTGTNTALTTVRYAPINSNGTIGTWITTAPSLPFNKLRAGIFTYTTSSGTYLYVIGGETQGSGGNTPKSYYSLIGSSGSLGAWSTASNDLSASHTYRSYAQVGKYIYAIGGWLASPATAYTAVEYTTIQSSGDLGAWSTTASLNTATGFSNGTTVNGCIYALGGEDNTSTSLANVQYACPAADGTISTWYNAPNLSVATTDMGVTSYNNFIYGVGGYTTSVQTTTQFAAVNNGGSGATGTWSTKAATLGSTLTSHGIAYSNGYFYLTGGDPTGSSATANTYYAVQNSDGSIGTWIATSSLNTARNSHATYISGGYAYVVGGVNAAGTTISSVEYAPINSNGTLGSWSAATGSLGTAHKQSAAAAYNGYLYSLGGNTGSLSTTVYYASAGSGDIASWSTTTVLPYAVRNASATTYNGYLYVAGGVDGSGNTAKVIYAPINSNGTLGSWLYTSALPLSGATSIVAANGHLYASGVDGASCSGNTYKAAIHANGLLSAFHQTTAASTCGKGNGTPIYANGYLYLATGNGVVGGAAMDSIPRIGQYTKLIDLSGEYGLTSLSYNGTLSNGGVANLSFKSASSNGILGSKQLASSLTGGAPSCSAANLKYVQVLASLDDTYSSVFPDTNSSASTLTDFTLNYATARATPSQRLMHGKYFSSEAQQGLDVCGNS